MPSKARLRARSEQEVLETLEELEAAQDHSLGGAVYQLLESRCAYARSSGRLDEPLHLSAKRAHPVRGAGTERVLGIQAAGVLAGSFFDERHHPAPLGEPLQIVKALLRHRHHLLRPLPREAL